MAQVTRDQQYGKNKSRVTVIHVDPENKQNREMGNKTESSSVELDLFPANMATDLEKLEIKTWSVEMALKPIIKTVTSLVSSRRNPSKRKGCSKKASTLVMAVEVATANFVEKGEAIASENPEARADIITVVGDVKKHGLSLVFTSREFAADPCNSGFPRPCCNTEREKCISPQKLN